MHVLEEKELINMIWYDFVDLIYLKIIQITNKNII
jgi:hypothetical protein